MSPFEALRGDMDARVSNGLGDSISVLTRDNETITLMAFVTVNSDPGGVEGGNAMRLMAHVKLDKSDVNLEALPNGPRDILRLTTSRVPGTYKPAVDTIDDDGGAWVFDLQKAKPIL